LWHPAKQLRFVVGENRKEIEITCGVGIGSDSLRLRSQDILTGCSGVSQMQSVQALKLEKLLRKEAT